MTSPVPLAAEAERSLVNWTTLIYGLHAFSIATGIVGTATVTLAFVTIWFVYRIARGWLRLGARRPMYG